MRTQFGYPLWTNDPIDLTAMAGSIHLELYRVSYKSHPITELSRVTNEVPQYVNCNYFKIEFNQARCWQEDDSTRNVFKKLWFGFTLLTIANNDLKYLLQDGFVFVQDPLIQYLYSDPRGSNLYPCWQLYLMTVPFENLFWPFRDELISKAPFTTYR